MYFVIEYFWMFNTLKMAAEKLNNPCIRISRLLSWITTSCFHSKTPTETCWCPLDGHQDTIWPIKTLSEHLFPAYKRSHRIEFRPGLFSILLSFYPSDSRLFALNGFTWHLYSWDTLWTKESVPWMEVGLVFVNIDLQIKDFSFILSQNLLLDNAYKIMIISAKFCVEIPQVHAVHRFKWDSSCCESCRHCADLWTLQLTNAFCG